MGPSAALTPAIWEKTIPYDGENFHLEYMDLEEFLMENGIPISESDDLSSSSDQESSSTQKVKGLKTEVPKAAEVALLPIQELDQCSEEVVIITKADSDITSDVTAGECGKTILYDLVSRLSNCRDDLQCRNCNLKARFY